MESENQKPEECEHDFNKLVFVDVPNRFATAASENPTIKVPVVVCCGNCGQAYHIHKIKQAVELLEPTCHSEDGTEYDCGKALKILKGILNQQEN